MFQLRQAEPSDVTIAQGVAVQTALAQLCGREAVIASPQGVAQRVLEMYRRALAPEAQGRLLVADTGAGMAGYLLLGVEAPPGSARVEATVLDIWVAPPWRGRGVVTALHRAALALATQAGATSLRAMVALHNGPSLQAHRRAGLTPEALVLGKRL